ncbi:MAG: TolC family protein [Chthoniobacterales bacterium]|nr:TolC family protein [Chthoniobacterales bacterium]
MKLAPGVVLTAVVFLSGASGLLRAQTPAPSPAAAGQNASEMMTESFPTSDQILGPEKNSASAPAASPVPSAAPAPPPTPVPAPTPVALAPMPAGMPTPMPSPTASPFPAITNTNVPGLDPQLDGTIEAGIPNPMQMTFPTVPDIPEPAVSQTNSPVTSIKLPPATSLELTLAPDAKTLKINDAVRTALTKNPEILTAIQQIRLTRGQVVQVRAALLPTLQAGSSYQWQDDNLANPGRPAGSLIQNQNSAWNVTLQVNQSIWSGWKNQADFSAARLANESAFYSLRQTIDQVVADTKVLFYQVIFNRALIRVREESVAVLQSQLQDQQSRFEAGTVPRFNVLQAEVALANAIPPVIQARNQLRIAQFALVKQLGLDYPSNPSQIPIDVTGQLDYDPIKIDLANSVFTALARNPSLKIQRQNILISAENLKAAMSGFQPTLNATAGWQAFNIPTAAQLDETVNGWFFGVTGSWNIFDGLATVGATQSARAALEQSKINYDNSARGVELDVQRAISNLIEAQEVIDSQRANVVQATEALRLSRERLDAGAGTQLDVLNAQVSLLQSQTTELEGTYRYITALAEYNRVLSLDTVYADTYDDPMLTLRDRRRNDLLNSTDNPNPGVLEGKVPRKNDTLRGAKHRARSTPPGATNQPSGANR